MFFCNKWLQPFWPHAFYMLSKLFLQFIGNLDFSAFIVTDTPGVMDGFTAAGHPLQTIHPGIMALPQRRICLYIFDISFIKQACAWRKTGPAGAVASCHIADFALWNRMFQISDQTEGAGDRMMRYRRILETGQKELQIIHGFDLIQYIAECFTQCHQFISCILILQIGVVAQDFKSMHAEIGGIPGRKQGIQIRFAGIKPGLCFLFQNLPCSCLICKDRMAGKQVRHMGGWIVAGEHL